MGESNPYREAAIEEMGGSREWYRDQYTRLMMVLLITMPMLLVSLVGNVMQAWLTPKPQYFATHNGSVIPVVPLDQPMVVEADLQTFVTETVTRTFGLDFKRWNQQLMAVRPRYSDTAFRDVFSSLQSEGILGLITSKKLITTAVPEAAPVLSASGLVDGRMTWRMEFPVVLTYESSNGIETTHYLVAKVFVQRVDTVKNPRGIEVIKLVAAPNKGRR